MSAFDEFRTQLHAMRAYLRSKGRDKDELVGIEVAGVDVANIMCNRGVVTLIGTDGGKEVVVVMPEGHFYAKLYFEKKKKDRTQIGFSPTQAKGADQIVARGD